MNTNELMSTLKIRLQDSVRSAAKRTGQATEHNLTIDDLFEQYKKQDGKCAELGVTLSGVRMKNGRYINANRWTGLSIDRLDCNKGYTPDNIRLTCWVVNSMRGTLPEDEARQQMFEFKEMLTSGLG